MAAVEKARAIAESRLEAAKALPTAYLRRVFPQPDEFLTEGWKWLKLGEVCSDISDGTHFTPNYLPKGIPFLSVKDIRETGILFDNCKYISEDQRKELCKRCKPEKRDVLYTKIGITGIAKAIDTAAEFSIFVSVALLKLGANIKPGHLW